MDDQMRSAVTALVHRLGSLGQSGISAADSDIKNLEDKLGFALPGWFRELQVNYPIGGIQLGIQDRSEVGEIDWMEWSTIDGIRSESVDCYPGIAILKSRWISVAGCSLGSGDPSFVPLDQGEDPPLYQVFHERYSGDEYEEVQGFQCERVAVTLSRFFRSAVVDQ